MFSQLVTQLAFDSFAFGFFSGFLFCLFFLALVSIIFIQIAKYRIKQGKFDSLRY